MKEIERLLEIMARLRDPKNGCPWDIEQTHESLKKYVIEEAYEVAEAIEDQNLDELRGELGDLLLQVVFHSQIAKENGNFDFEAVAEAINDKMIARHPHVFGDAGARTSDEQSKDWERIKAKERADKGEVSVLDGVAKTLPALTRAYKLQKRAAQVGFDWDDTTKVREKINEELDELEAAAPHEQISEFGDLLFAVVNFGRHLGIDPEMALRTTNRKFMNRFDYIEKSLSSENQNIRDTSLERMEELWNEAKSRGN